MAHSYADSMEEELTCCVCFELFVDPHTPKMLNCPHVICELCLKRLVKDSAIDCPQCRVITRLSKDGVAALRTNLGIYNLAEKHQKHLEKQKHQIHPSSQSRTQDDQVPVCPDHGEKMHFYCVTCNILVCRACTVVDHKQPQHEIQDVKVLHKEKMKLSDATIDKLEKDALQCEKKSREIGETEQTILSSIKMEEEKIDRTVALLMEKACEQSDALKSEIRRKNDPKLKLCQERKELLQKKAHALRSIVADTRAVSEVTSTNDFLMRHKALMDKIKTIPAHSDEGLVQYQPGEVEFKAKQLALKLGTITVTPSKQNAAKKRNTVGLVRKIKLTAKLEGFTMTIISMASNRSGDILAISEGNSKRHKVHIYCKQTNGQYEKQSSLKVNSFQFGHSHCHVAIAADGKYLVANGRSIHEYSTSGQCQRVCYTAPAHTNNTGKILVCITTTKDGRIIAGDYARSVITVHTPDGMTMLKTINTSIKPQRITAINNTYVAISHCDVNKVYVIDLESGRETLSIDFDFPSAICYDEETYCLLIGRPGEIDQYSLLTRHKVACISQKYGRPRAMILMSNGMLAVSEDKAVSLYQTSVK